MEKAALRSTLTKPLCLNVSLADYLYRLYILVVTQELSKSDVTPYLNVGKVLGTDALYFCNRKRVGKLGNLHLGISCSCTTRAS